MYPIIYLIVSRMLFLIFLWHTTVGDMKRSGVRGCEPIPYYWPCQRKRSLQIALKPACTIPVVELNPTLIREVG